MDVHDKMGDPVVADLVRYLTRLDMHDAYDMWVEENGDDETSFRDWLQMMAEDAAESRYEEEKLDAMGL